MSRVVVRAALMAAISVGIAGGAVLLTSPLVRVPKPPPRSAAPSAARSGAAVELAVSLERATARPLFRRGRRPARTPFDPSGTGADAATAEPAAPRPAVTLSGILWGRVPLAVLEGVPGSAGSTVMRSGEGAGGVRVTGIGRERVTVEGFDTTWVLTLRKPWH